MTASMFQGEGGFTSVVGQDRKGHLPGPVPALSKGSEGPVMSDLQRMLHDEKLQHQQHYQYANGHNDHGMGQ